VKITYKKVETINEFIDAIRIRVDVFILEQKCPPGWDPEELDKVATHYIAIADDEIVASVRLREEPKTAIKIENMVVKKAYRGKGVGLGLAKYVLTEAKKRKPTKIWAETQSYTQKFYQKAGFITVSDEYDLYDLGIPHVKMEYKED